MRKVFISSTSEDLEAYRTAARDAVIATGCLPVMMEYFTPQGRHKPYPACMREVDECDVVIAIVAHRYGWVPEDQPESDSKSITWLECERAKEVIAFVIDEKHSWPAELKEAYRLTKAIEDGSFTAELAAEVQRNVARLKEFKSWVNKLGFRATFTNEHDIKAGVLQALLGKGGTRADPSKYLAWLREFTSWIDIRGLQVGAGKAYRFPIQDLYIPLTTAAAVDKDVLSRKVALQEALTRKRVVIIGDPGSGKTTFLRRLAYETYAPTGDFALPAGTFPVFIRIGELEEHISSCIDRKEKGTPTTAEDPEWLAHFLASRKWDLDGNYFDKKMHEELTLVLLDGLDEAPDSRTRERLARLFEKATQRYAECRFVVTTRPGAYQGLATVAGFEQVRIEDLGDDAVERFLEHWSRALHAANPEGARAHQAALLDAVRARPAIRRMARNPVMLTALAVVHWNERRLPEQRAELYESVLGWLAKAREKPGRERAERCLTFLAQLALGMQDQPKGRVRQIGKRTAAEIVAPQFRDTPEQERIGRAERFLEEEEVDSGIVVQRGNSLEFWHLTFQEHLSARAIAGMTDAAQHQLLFAGRKLYSAEWREVLLLYAGLLAAKQGLDKVDAMFSAILDRQGKELADRARCAGLLGAMLADLKPFGYNPQDSRYQELMDAVLAIFDADKAAGIPLKIRVQAAEALGQAGDPRLRENNWITIPASSFVMGEGDEAHEVELDAYEIGRFPVTVEEYARFVEDGGPEPPEWDKQVLYPNRPVVSVNWHNAAAYCSWAGVRLPTEAEWERAARGPERRLYPWGTGKPDATRANYGKEIGAPTPVGLFPKGATPDGIFDLAGNVWEWVADWHGEYPSGKQRNPHGPESGRFKVARGSAWDDGLEYLPAARRLTGSPEATMSYRGFRCARGVHSS